MIKLAKKRKNTLIKIWNYWTNLVGSIALLVLGGAMASKTLGPPTFLARFDFAVGLVVVAGWFLVFLAASSIVFSSIAFTRKL